MSGALATNTSHQTAIQHALLEQVTSYISQYTPDPRIISYAPNASGDVMGKFASQGRVFSFRLSKKGLVYKPVIARKDGETDESYALRFDTGSDILLEQLDRTDAAKAYKPKPTVSIPATKAHGTKDNPKCSAISYHCGVCISLGKNCIKNATTKALKERLQKINSLSMMAARGEALPRVKTGVIGARVDPKSLKRKVNDFVQKQAGGKKSKNAKVATKLSTQKEFDNLKKEYAKQAEFIAKNTERDAEIFPYGYEKAEGVKFYSVKGQKDATLAVKNGEGVISLRGAGDQILMRDIEKKGKDFSPSQHQMDRDASSLAISHVHANKELPDIIKNHFPEAAKDHEYFTWLKKQGEGDVHDREYHDKRFKNKDLQSAQPSPTIPTLTNNEVHKGTNAQIRRTGDLYEVRPANTLSGEKFVGDKDHAEKVFRDAESGSARDAVGKISKAKYVAPVSDSPSRKAVAEHGAKAEVLSAVDRLLDPKLLTADKDIRDAARSDVHGHYRTQRDRGDGAYAKKLNDVINEFDGNVLRRKTSKPSDQERVAELNDKISALTSKQELSHAEQERVIDLVDQRQEILNPKKESNYVPLSTTKGMSSDRPSQPLSRKVFKVDSVDLEGIHTKVPASAFNKQELSHYADLMINSGGTASPIILKQHSPISFEVLRGHKEYHAALEAQKKDPRFEAIDAFIVRNDNEANAATKQYDSLNKGNSTSVSISDVPMAKNPKKLTKSSIDLEGIRSALPRNNFSEQHLEETRKALEEVGDTFKPILVKQTGGDKYEVLRGHDQYYAALEAQKRNPSFEAINAYIVPKDQEKAALAQYDAVNGGDLKKKESNYVPLSTTKGMSSDRVKGNRNANQIAIDRTKKDVANATARINKLDENIKKLKAGGGVMSESDLKRVASLERQKAEFVAQREGHRAKLEGLTKAEATPQPKYVHGHIRVGSQRAERAEQKVRNAIPSAKFATKSSLNDSDKMARFTFENTPENIDKFRSMGGSLTKDQRKATQREENEALDAKSLTTAIADGSIKDATVQGQKVKNAVKSGDDFKVTLADGTRATVSGETAVEPKTSPAYYLNKARYAKGKMAVRVNDSKDGFKGKASYLAEYYGGKYSNRENAYIISPSAAKKFEQAMVYAAKPSHDLTLEQYLIANPPLRIFKDQPKNHTGKDLEWAKSAHKGYVERALSEGKPVSAEVLKDYPDLKAPAPVEPRLAQTDLFGNPVAIPEPTPAVTVTAKPKAKKQASSKVDVFTPEMKAHAEKVLKDAEKGLPSIKDFGFKDQSELDLAKRYGKYDKKTINNMVLSRDKELTDYIKKNLPDPNSVNRTQLVEELRTKVAAMKADIEKRSPISVDLTQFGGSKFEVQPSFESVNTFRDLLAKAKNKVDGNLKFSSDGLAKGTELEYKKALESGDIDKSTYDLLVGNTAKEFPDTAMIQGVIRKNKKGKPLEYGMVKTNAKKVGNYAIHQSTQGTTADGEAITTNKQYSLSHPASGLRAVTSDDMGDEKTPLRTKKARLEAFANELSQRIPDIDPRAITPEQRDIFKELKDKAKRGDYDPRKDSADLYHVRIPNSILVSRTDACGCGNNSDRVLTYVTDNSGNMMGVVQMHGVKYRFLKPVYGATVLTPVSETNLAYLFDLAPDLSLPEDNPSFDILSHSSLEAL